MSKIEELLSSYEDFELAFVYTYLYKTYLPETRTTIDAIIKQRGLTQEKIISLVEEKMKQEYIKNETVVRCPRCKSEKIEGTQELIYYPSHNPSEGQTPKYMHYRCNVCGYDINNDKKTGKVLKTWLKNIFSSKKKKKK